jgi:serine/threonine protein kinase
MLVFEYLAGGTLADRLEDGALSVTEAVELGVALSAVLIAIHNASVLHRDIKPSNIGFTADATPKLLDFGLARIITALGTGESSSVAHGELGPLQDAERGSEAELRGGMTSNSVVRGTFLYMSPEALLGDTPSPGFDLWSLSVALYEAMAGANPLAALGGSGSLAVMNGYVFPDIRSAAPTAPAAVADFFGHALAAEPARRPRTAEQLHEQLRSLRITSAESLSVATPPGVARLR